jgi:hypothetical protein
MKTYISVGIGDMMCVDSILSQQERDNISEIYWACRFGKDIIPLFENNPGYPNIKNHHIISDQVGMSEMQKLESHAGSFWHFRPDFNLNFIVGKSLFNNIENIATIDAANLIGSTRPYNNSTFLDAAKLEDIPWDIYNISPHGYILVHYPTSTRPRGDIASLDDKDWSFIKNKAVETGLKIVIITDTHINTEIDALILFKPPIKTIVALVKYCLYYMGCDSFCSILATKVVDKSNISIKSHNPDIQNHVLNSAWLQRNFLPLSPQEISQIYKNFIG